MKEAVGRTQDRKIARPMLIIAYRAIRSLRRPLKFNRLLLPVSNYVKFVFVDSGTVRE